MSKIGCGILTYNRVGYFNQCIDAFLTASPSIDYLCIYDDGSEPHGYASDRDDLTDWCIDTGTKFWFHNEDENKGAAHGKNWLLMAMMEEGCDYLFLLEDDQQILSKDIFDNYIEASRESGLEHLVAHHHHGTNRVPMCRDGLITYWPNRVGGFSFYTYKSIYLGGMLEEEMINAYDDVEHTARLAMYELTKADLSHWPDATGSENWIEEIDDSRYHTAIKGDLPQMGKDALAIWREARPSSYNYLWMGNTNG